MGILDSICLYQRGARMKGVLIEWELVAWIFYIFHFLHIRTCHTIQKTIYKMLYPI